MITISGEVREIIKRRELAPKDGIHDADKHGFVRGARAYTLNGNLLPRGMVGFYYRLDEARGIKVYYSFKKDFCSPLRTVERCRNNMKLLAKQGVALHPGKIVRVRIDFRFNGKRIIREPFGVVVSHVFYPQKEWVDYLHGKAYAWGSSTLDDDERQHSPIGLIKFREKLAKAVSGLGLKIDARGKLGDVLYCTKRNRWILVDCG